MGASGPEGIQVHGLLVCRNVEAAAEGRVDLGEVLEVVAVDAFPGDAGPLCFVAFLRGLPAGDAEAAFVVRPVGHRDHVTASLPLDVRVPEGAAERQMVVQVRIGTVPVKHGGWYEVELMWGGRVLATNRFAIGARKHAAPDASGAG